MADLRRVMRVATVLLAAAWLAQPERTAMAQELPAPQGAARPAELPPPGAAAALQPMIVDVRIVGHKDVLNKVASFIRRAPADCSSEPWLPTSRACTAPGCSSTKTRTGRRRGVVVLFKVVERPTIQHLKFLGRDASPAPNSKKKLVSRIGSARSLPVEEGKSKIEKFYARKATAAFAQCWKATSPAIAAWFT